MPHTDPLARGGNQLSFYEWLRTAVQDNPNAPFTMIALDLNKIKDINIQHGIKAGDAVLRWASSVLTEETNAPVYRVGGDEFVVVLTGSDRASHAALAEKVLERLNREGSQVHLHPPVAKVAVIRFKSGLDLSETNVMSEIHAALGEIKADPSQAMQVFDAAEMQPSFSLRRAVRDIRALVTVLEQFAAEYDELHHMAYTDEVTGLPNSRAALQELELVLAESKLTQKPFAVLLLDGDCLSSYNEISYIAGDEMLSKLAATQQEQLRAGDFLARWRMGDEFLIIMPATPMREAFSVGERIRAAVSKASQDWQIPVTVSAGLAVYPAHGDSVSELLYHVDAAKRRAKSLGKNQITLPF